MRRRALMCTLIALWFGAVGVACAWVLADQFQSQPAEAMGRCAMAFGFALTACLLAGERSQRGNAFLFALLVVAWLIALAGLRPIGWLAVPGLVVSGWVPVLAGLALLRYPRARLEKSDRRFVTVLALIAPVFQVGLLCTNRSEEVGYAAGQWPRLVDDPDAQFAVWLAKGVWLGLSVVVFLVLMWRRWRRLGGLERRTLAPVVLVGSALAIALVVSKLVPVDSETLGLVFRLVRNYLAAALGLAFAVSALRLRLASTAISGLTARLNDDGSVPAVQEALRDALLDDTLEVWYWAPDLDEYVDRAGHGRGNKPTAGRLVVDTASHDGAPLARITAHESLRRHEAFVRSAVDVCRLALENTRLEATLRSQLLGIQEARSRLLHTGLAQRRQLEQDLHDGAQQRLLAIGMRLGAIVATSREPATAEAVRHVQTEVHVALAELRDLAHGLYPVALAQGGLHAALAAVADRMSVDVKLDIPRTRWDPAVEAAAYLTACEGVTNAVKHAAPRSICIRVEETSADLVVHIDDDGIGCDALVSPVSLPHLRDRLAALGGQLDVRSDTGSGTSLTALIPCR